MKSRQDGRWSFVSTCRNRLRNYVSNHLAEILGGRLTFLRYSGVAWAWSETFEQSQNIVSRWPELQGTKNSAKVPSKILFDDPLQPKWGFGIPENSKPLEWFKLLLLDESSIPPDVNKSEKMVEARKRLKESGKTAEEVVTKYLELLWNHALTEMKNVYPATAIDGQPLLVVLTHPAIWSFPAQYKLKQCAIDAGITTYRPAGETKLYLYPEPEAASLAIMDDYQSQPVDVSKDTPVVTSL